MTSIAHTLQDIRLADIVVVEGFNPRRHFNAEPLASLVESIKRDGVFTPITVRRTSDDSLKLIAGERRLRASREAGLETIPAKVIECDDATALRIAILENQERVNLSVAEQALVARDYLDLYEGDVGLACADLGWSESKMRARLLLLQASPAVLDAAGAGTITAGHAELLSALPVANQDKALPQIIESSMTVGQLKEMLRGFVIPLSTAIFNLDGCKGCPRNSETQSDFFTHTVEGANCQDKICFRRKTDEAIEARRAQLLEEVSTVALASEKAPGTYTLLMRDGKTGVGDAQFSACRACKNFGALIHSKLDARCGQVDRPTCFDVQCNATKVKEYAEERAAAEAAQHAEASAPATGGASDTAAPRKRGQAVGAVAKKKSKTVAQASGPVRDHIKSVYRNAASALMDADGRALLAVAVVAISKLRASSTSASAVDSALGDSTGSYASNAVKIAKLSNLPQAELAALVKTVCKDFIIDTEQKFDHSGMEAAVRLAQTHGVDLAGHFTMSQEFLASNTMAAIESLLDESGFSAWLSAQPDGEARAKALGRMKKSDLPAAVMGEGFDWTGFVPAVIRSATPESLSK
ncbi:MAG: hypothetical protein BGP25_15795 [Lysobacterales bacterium 63-13]|nr:MAG: hypothetical protein BGP25_15795 [Xanthomonadales bacterium 63-13]